MTHDEEQAASDLIDIIGVIARAIPIEEAVAILMATVAHLIQDSPHATSYWTQLASKVEGYRLARPHIIVKGSNRLQ